MSRGRVIGAIVAVVVILAIAAGLYFSAQARVPQVTVVKVQKQDLTQTVTASGQTEADEEGQVFPPTQGTLQVVYVVDGQTVKAGQALAMMDTAPLEAAVDQARATYLQGVAQEEQVEKGVPTDEQFVAAEAGVSGNHAQYKAAKKNLKVARANEASATQRVSATRSVARSNPASPAAQVAYNKELDAWRQLTGATASAKANVKMQYAAYRNAIASQSQLDVQADVDAALDSADAQQTAAAAQLLIAEDDLAHATLTAPIDGVVTFGGAGAQVAAAGGGTGGAAAGAAGKPTTGSTVSPASAPFTVTQLDALNFNAQVDEADIAHVQVGQKALVTLDAFPGEPFESKVVQVKTQAIQTSTGGTAFPVLITIHGTGKRVLVGMGGNVDVQVSGIENAVTVPVEALFDEGGSTYVYRVEGNTVHRVKVKTGVLTDTQAQILDGVQPGELVALGGLSNLKDGMTVRVK